MFRKKKDPQDKKVRKEPTHQNIEDKTLEDVEKEYEQKDEYEETKTSESILNIIIFAVLIGLLTATGWHFFGDNIKEYIGMGTEYINEQDIDERLDRYREDISSEINRAKDKEIEEELEQIDLADSPKKIDAGPYLVGYDIVPGQYLFSEGTTYSIYEDEYALVNDNPKDSTRGRNNSIDPNDSKPLEANKVIKLKQGEYVTIHGGVAVRNNDRESTDVKINESVVVESGNNYTVGIDFPAGYYRVVAVKYQSGTSIKREKDGKNDEIGGIKPETSTQIKRQSYIKLNDGAIVTFQKDAILTRVDKGFIY